MTYPYLHNRHYSELTSAEIDAAGIRDEWERWWQWEYLRERPLPTNDVEPGTDWTRNTPL